jgi:hypothetical protein
VLVVPVGVGVADLIYGCRNPIPSFFLTTTTTTATTKKDRSGPHTHPWIVFAEGGDWEKESKKVHFRDHKHGFWSFNSHGLSLHKRKAKKEKKKH